MRKGILFTTILFCSLALILSFPEVRGQDSLRLEICHELLRRKAPRAADRERLKAIAQLEMEKSSSAWKPALNLNARASYQSDVVAFSMEGLPFEVDLPEAPKDQYGLNLDVQQTLYDGGLVRSRKKMERAQLAADLQKVEVDLHSLKTSLNTYYFGLLLLQQNRRNLDLLRANLQSRRQMMKQAFEAGAMLGSGLKVVELELLKLDQQEAELREGISTCLAAISILCDTSLAENTVLVLPEQLTRGDELQAGDHHVDSRPEQRWFELQEASLEAGKALIAQKRMPILYAYGQLGYGNPGYNILGAEWDSYYLLGAGLRWNIWDWRQNRREQAQLSEQQQMLYNRREQFEKELELGLSVEEIRIARLEAALITDEAILSLQSDLASTAALQLEEGVITAIEYVEALNEEHMARINRDANRIKLARARTNLLTIRGEL